jgi:hypothetical protein
MMLPQGQPRNSPVPTGLMLQYLVVLAGTDPLVWRRILVPATYSFWDLHVAVQDSMGWSDYHLHQFRVLDPSSGTTMLIGLPDPHVPDDPSVIADWDEFPLDYTSGDAPPIQYLYDFGDDWSHAVIFEDFEERSGGAVGPECVAGAGACPPEDCGGPHGYRNLVDVLGDPGHAEYKDLLDWAGGPIKPEEFDISEVHFDDPEARWRTAFEGGAI